MPTELSTPRLRIIALSAKQLELCLNNLVALGNECGFPISSKVVDTNVTRAINLKLTKMATIDTRLYDWFTYWLIVIKDSSIGVGLIGFKGYPNIRGETEIGYGIEEGFRNQGYMTEAVTSLVDWAFGHPECQAITAKSVSNPVSARVLEKLQWQIIRQKDGSVDWEIRKGILTGTNMDIA
jgi:[ribosomal protein S5]-alanine N-acetyltransferase